jgi:hypothetical protein
MSGTSNFAIADTDRTAERRRLGMTPLRATCDKATRCGPSRYHATCDKATWGGPSQYHTTRHEGYVQIIMSAVSL